MQSECLMVDHEKCTTQSALNVDKNAKFPSSLTRTDLYIAESVMLNEDHREEIDTKHQLDKSYFLFSIFFTQFFIISPTWRM